jgi:hypothetical protein
MADNKDDYYSLNDITNQARQFFVYLRKKFWLFVLVALIGGGLGAYYYTIQKPKYEAVTTFILEEKSSGGGGLAGLASQFGFDVGGIAGGGSIFAGDNILDILRSKTIVEQVLLTKAKTNEKKAAAFTLADLFLEYTGWKKKWNDPELKSLSFASVNGNESLSPKQDSVLNEIYGHLLKHAISAERLNKKGSIIRVQVTAANSEFAKLLTERMVTEAAGMYLEIKTGTAQANIEKLQRRSDSLLALLNRKSYAAAASQPLDINPGIRSAIVPVEIANRDKTVLATLYAEVTKNLEASKLLLSQQTPVIQMLDKPGHLLNSNKKTLPVLVAVSAVVAIIVSIMIAFALFLFSCGKNKRMEVAVPKTHLIKQVEIPSEKLS